MNSIFNKISDYSYRKKYTDKYYEDKYSAINKKEIVAYLLSEQCQNDIKQLSKGNIFFNAPVMKKIPKGKGSYRYVFHYEDKDVALLSLIVRALFNEYDYLFSNNLYSYRQGISNYDAFKKIKDIKEREALYIYKVDVSSYDTCINKAQLNQIIVEKIDDVEMINFLCCFIEFNKYIYKDKLCFDSQAVRAGSPLTPFFEDLYLIDYDEEIVSKCNSYFRFNDDILIYGTKKQIDECVLFTKDFFLKKKLKFNEKKTKIIVPNEEVEFLGMRINDDIDISSSIINNIRFVLTKKARSILVLKKGLDLDDDFAMELMLKYEKTLYPYLKLLFGKVTKIDGIRKIDNIMQDCLRYVGSGKFNKCRYRIRYKTLQELGYTPLVSIYYQWDWKKDQ